MPQSTQLPERFGKLAWVTTDREVQFVTVWRELGRAAGESEAVNRMIQTRVEVLNSVSQHHAPSQEIGLFSDLDRQPPFREIRAVMEVNNIGCVIPELGQFVYESYDMFICPVELALGTQKEVRHEVSSTYERRSTG
jgi:hypothetical protein